MKNKPQTICDECNGSGLIPIALGVRGLRICPICKGAGAIVPNADVDVEVSMSDNNSTREKLINLLYGHSLVTKEDAGYVADILINAGMTIVKEPKSGEHSIYFLPNESVVL